MKLSVFQKKYLKIAKQIIEQVSKEVSPYIKDLSKIKPLYKNPKGDITLTIDRVAEKCAEKILKKNNVSGIIIGEEYGTRKIGKGMCEFILLLDPIDGSHNAERGMPFYSTVLSFATYSDSPALQDVEIGIVKNLTTRDIFIGVKGNGAILNGKKISSSQRTSLKDVDIIINLEGKTNKIDRYLKLISSVRDVKRFGSCALEICYTASGAVDVFFDPRETVSLLDTSASLLIASEAGCIITDAYGEKQNPPLEYSTKISLLCCGNRLLHKKILKLIR